MTMACIWKWFSCLFSNTSAFATKRRAADPRFLFQIGYLFDIPHSVSCVQGPTDISWLLSWLSALCLSLRLTGICQPFLMGVFFLSRCNLFVWRIWFYLLQTRKNNVCCSKKEQRLTDRYTLSISMLSCYACGLIVHVFNTSTLAHHCT